MNRQTPFILIILLGYIFFPSLLAWLTDARGVWYKPYLAWLLIIALAFAVTERNRRNDS